MRMMNHSMVARLASSFLALHSISGLAEGYRVHSFVELDSSQEAQVFQNRSFSPQICNPRGSFPVPDTHGFQHAKYLGSGSFGEVWEVTVNDGSLWQGHRVIVKIFYKSVRGGGCFYLTPENYMTYRNDVDAAVNECSLMKNLQKDSPHGDIGKTRIAQCIGERASPKKHFPRVPLYLVLEKGGDSLATWITKTHATRNIDDVRRIMGHLLQAERTLNERLSPGFLHHDLKPANLVYDDGTSTARMIDFGGLVVASPQNERTPNVATPAYTPPEAVDPEIAFVNPPHSFDIWALGQVYLELVCPDKNWHEVMAIARRQPLDFQSNCPRVPAADQEVIRLMLSPYPSQRPRASTILANTPFREIAHSIQESASTPPAAPAGNLLASILPVNEHNPNVIDSEHENEMLRAIPRVKPLTAAEAQWAHNMPKHWFPKGPAQPL